MPQAEAVPSNKGTHPNVLKRNQACHQCRRRKLKCDAKRPCSTCIRSHAHAVSHAPPGVELPPAPECTYDEAAEVSTPAAEGPRSRYERLENRINELEALLRQKEQRGIGHPRNSPHATEPPMGPLAMQSLPFNGDPMLKLPGLSPLLPEMTFGTQPDGRTRNDGVGSYSHGGASFGARIDSISPASNGNSAEIATSSTNASMVWAAWPPNLPSADLVRHLVDAFFAFHPHSNRLFHAPTFMSWLSLPPTHAKFPNTAILHAICALGSLYTAAVSSPPRPNLAEEPPDELFTKRYRSRRSETFADIQANYAKELLDEQLSIGENLFEVLQAGIILTWYYWAHARWCDVYLASSVVMRLSVAQGLSSCPPFHTIANSTRPLSLLPRAMTVIEDEMRRNTFWLAYSAERLHGCGNGWALCLDDMDVSQILPMRGDQFLQGSLVSPGERLWSHSKNIFRVHPSDQTDSFVLYIKAAMLISRVKNFNLRFRARQYTGDAATIPADTSHPHHPHDPRTTPAFIELDRDINSFRSSFPRHLSDPIEANIVDCDLYTACTAPHIASILLHEPHAELDHRGCFSACKILEAARGVLDLIYAVMSTSYDISLLDNFVTFAWFMAGRILVRFLEAAQLSNGHEQIPQLVNEIFCIRVAMAKMGERLPLAYRYTKMLTDFLVQKCGEASAPSVIALAPRWPMLPPAPATAYYEAAEAGTHFESAVRSNIELTG
ncbi:hypothetical protein NEOLEDRAFT_1053482 [Neolentinus lepideus HHB14362 ss-1]|uniref:Zn(2)-C6 fungal-type domain-containing protein n=1 Tax=Neolentinus lepideus HHB14362 ss-1 TaxID=1314782 RepID=A0A165W0L4_9AGAM|nr:hypothetical protein NEOLEDRAFT_1053482 [Neolentinus lepideus HHB14362 ss-1]